VWQEKTGSSRFCKKDVCNSNDCVHLKHFRISINDIFGKFEAQNKDRTLAVTRILQTDRIFYVDIVGARGPVVRAWDQRARGLGFDSSNWSCVKNLSKKVSHPTLLATQQ
jgi:hypothetical protein